jgi:peptidoglycan/xylan/chitin deacetylase (PgdA/CDA1 family)
MRLRGLREALDRRAAAGLAPLRLWLRDDDAVAPTPALDRLLGLAGGGLPVTIAAIPAFATPALAARLAGRPGVTVAVHGWAHRNHAPAGEKPQELGAHRPAATVAAELAAGRDRIAALFGPAGADILVPPWNRIAPAVAARLPALGFTLLSAFADAAFAGIATVNPRIDPIDWRGARGTWPEARLDAALAAAAARDDLPHLGILTHHLVHDAAAWAFLEALAGATAGHPACRWVALAALAG